MDPLLAYAQAKQDDIITFLREMVECESPSGDPGAIERFADLVEARVADIARVRRVRAKGFGPHLLCEFDLPGRGKRGQVLALGHSDTVYDVGTLARMPWRRAEGRLWGPGVLDMKGGIAFFVFAMRALRELNIAVRRKVVLQLNSD